MTGSIMLFMMSNIFILSFFWLLFLGLSVGHRLRQLRLERQELGILPSPSKNMGMKHLLAYIHSPLDEMQIWHSQKAQEKPERIPGPTVLPMRYRQTLLFADDLGETHPNPRTKAS